MDAVFVTLKSKQQIIEELDSDDCVMIDGF